MKCVKCGKNLSGKVAEYTNNFMSEIDSNRVILPGGVVIETDVKIKPKQKLTVYLCKCCDIYNFKVI